MVDLGVNPERVSVMDLEKVREGETLMMSPERFLAEAAWVVSPEAAWVVSPEEVLAAVA